MPWEPYRRNEPMHKPSAELLLAFRQLAESLQQLSDALTALSARLGSPVYERHNRPFGPSERAREIWIRHRQYTTRN